MLTKRDKAIIKDLNKFRVMDRDSIAELHFKHLKNPKDAANSVLLRLLRENHIQRSTSFTPYVYFGPDVTMKQNSAKIGHFLAIVDVYKEIMRLEKTDTFLVEPKYGKKGECAEPDIFTIYRNTPFFIEVQNSLFNEKQVRDKINRYVDLFNMGINTHFPHVLILSEQRYAIDDNLPFKVFQAESFTKFINSLRPADKPQSVTKSEGIKIKVGMN